MAKRLKRSLEEVKQTTIDIDKPFKIKPRKKNSMFMQSHIKEAMSGTTPHGKLLRDHPQMFVYGILQFLSLKQAEQTSRAPYSRRYFRKAGKKTFPLLVEIDVTIVAEHYNMPRVTFDKALIHLVEKGLIVRIRKGAGLRSPIYLLGIFKFPPADIDIDIVASWKFDNVDILLTKKLIGKIDVGVY